LDRKQAPMMLIKIKIQDAVEVERVRTVMTRQLKRSPTKKEKRTKEVRVKREDVIEEDPRLPVQKVKVQTVLRV